MSGSCRTTRQLLDAVLHAKGGDTVIYVVPNAGLVDYCIDLLNKADVLTHPAATWMPAARRFVFDRPGGVLMVRSVHQDPYALRGLRRLRIEFDHACDERNSVGWRLVEVTETTVYPRSAERFGVTVSEAAAADITRSAFDGIIVRATAKTNAN